MNRMLVTLTRQVERTHRSAVRSSVRWLRAAFVVAVAALSGVALIAVLIVLGGGFLGAAPGAPDLVRNFA